MLPAPLPADEDTRLDALRRLLILDTPPEERFDRLVRFAAEELDMPVALLSLVDHDRQWFKARVGLDVSQTPRDVSFCGHAITSPGVFVVGDAQADERFADNPLVTGAPGIRFYAGAPLALPGGAVIGTLCVIDTRPRTLDRIELAVLRALRDLAVEQLAAGAHAP